MSKILVVDDLLPNLEYLRDALEGLGYGVVTASDGEEALQKIHTACPDLVLLDLSMPVLDGIEVLHILRKDPRYEDLPVLLLTASRDLSDRVRGLNAGANDYILKPFHIAEVEARIRAHLRIQALQQEALERQKLLSRIEGAGQALVTLSHHINNAAQAMSGMAQVCQIEPEDLRQHQDLVAIVLRQTARVSAVLACLHRVVNSLEVRTTDYAGDPDRMIDIEAELEQRLADLEADDPPG